MADLSDVLHALRDVAAAVLYPAGVPQGQAVPRGADGAPVRLYVGWPDAGLDKDLAAGICQVTIWPRPGMTRALPVYLTGWVAVPPPAPSLTATVTGNQVAFGGTDSTPRQIAALIVDQRRSYAYALMPGDGPAAVAAALGQQAAAHEAVTVAGAVLALPGATTLVARVVAGARERREVRRLSHGLQVTVWSSSPALRDALARRIDAAFIEDSRTLDLADGTKATVTYDGTAYDEDARQQPLHRRDLLLSVEYVQIVQRDVPAVAVPVTEVEGEFASVRQVIIS